MLIFAFWIFLSFKKFLSFYTGLKKYDKFNYIIISNCSSIPF